MARPVKCRKICREPAYDCFIPQDIPGGENVYLSLDKYETIRLIDYERCTQEPCAMQMEISRSTVTALYENARNKIADCIINGKELQISGGHYRFCDGESGNYCKQICEKENEKSPERQHLNAKGAGTMRIAVTYDNGEVFQHFGHTEQFKIYDVEDGKIINEQIVDTNGQGHGALSGFLLKAKVDVLICGGIGGGAQTALQEAGITLYGGVSGNTDQAVKSYIADTLDYDQHVKCDHHNHEEGHSCSEDKHGCGGN